MTASDAPAAFEREPAQAARKVAGEAFTAAWAGQPLSDEISFQGPTSLCRGEGEMKDGAFAMPSGSLASSETLAPGARGLTPADWSPATLPQIWKSGASPLLRQNFPYQWAGAGAAGTSGNGDR